MFDIIKFVNYLIIESLKFFKEVFDEVKETVLPLVRSFRKWAQMIEKEVDKDMGKKPKSKSKKAA